MCISSVVILAVHMRLFRINMGQGRDLDPRKAYDGPRRILYMRKSDESVS